MLLKTKRRTTNEFHFILSTESFALLLGKLFQECESLFETVELSFIMNALKMHTKNHEDWQSV